MRRLTICARSAGWWRVVKTNTENGVTLCGTTSWPPRSSRPDELYFTHPEPDFAPAERRLPYADLLREYFANRTAHANRQADVIIYPG
jgi:hypothetical protein